MFDEPPVETYKFIDISGYGASGKTALINMLQEFDERYYVPHHSFEFGLLRIQGGLVNLFQDLVSNWSPSRSDTAIKNFDKLTRKMAYNPNWYNIVGRFFSTGMRYNHYFNGLFLQETQKYIEKLIEFKYKGLSPYPFQNIPLLRYSVKKILSKIFGRNDYFSEVMLLSINDEDCFYQYTRDYLNNLFALVAGPSTQVFALYNTCEPYNPLQSLNFFHAIKQIIVDRDPRDLYLSTKQVDQFVGIDHQGFSASDDLESFVYRYRKLRESSNINLEASDKVLRVCFEDLVLRYDEICNKIYRFLGEDSSVHVNKKKYFNPDVSVKGVGMWKSTNKKNEIAYISQHLSKYCRDY